MFKSPQSIPQDLLLIHGLIGDITSSSKGAKTCEPPQKFSAEDSIDSSGDESDSGDEVEAIEADLLVEGGNEEPLSEELQPAPGSSSNDDTDTSSDCDSDADSQANNFRTLQHKSQLEEVEDEDDDCGVPAAAAGTYIQTKNEVIESGISIPDIEAVGPEEELERVGEVIGIMEMVVIVRGTESEITGRGAERALDSGTLLVFGDRKVLGYVYETFGPTSQPLYQVKFNHAYPLHPEKVQISRPVFHVPNRSNFVFLNQIEHTKGSDASNVHDEEPADDELEFSDDEQEAAFKSRRKRKRGELRETSIASSRYGTPTPSQMHDQDLAGEFFLADNAYDDHGPFDMDLGAGPSRPAPMPYDDPYSDEFNIDTSRLEAGSHGHNQGDGRKPHPVHAMGGRRPERGHGRGDCVRRYTTEAGRARGRGRGRGERAQKGCDIGLRASIPNSDTRPDRQTVHHPVAEQHDSGVPRPLSPTSLAIARATGQFQNGASFAIENQTEIPRSWHPQSHQQPLHNPYDFNSPVYPQQYVQPHINPRFASTFGMNVNFMPAPYPHLATNSTPIVTSRSSLPSWTDEWTVPTAPQDDNGFGY